MKNFKKMMALVIAMVMVLAMGVTVFAASEYSITVKNTNDAMSINGKDYKAYKVFDLTLGAEDTTTTPATYGAYAYSIKNTDWAFATLTTGATTNSTTGVITTKYGITLTPSAADPTVYSVDGTGMTDTNAREFADALQPVLPGTADGTGTGASEEALIELTKAGWYAVYGVVVPTDPNMNPAEEVVAAVGLTTTDKTVTVNPKASVPTINKEIKKVQEGTKEISDALLDEDGKAAVAKVGSKVSYDITATTPDLTGYDDYTYIISDSLTAGLDYDKSSFALKINGETAAFVTSATAATTDNELIFATGDKSFTLTIPYSVLLAAGAGKDVVLSYICTVNDNALNYDYENNTASLEYSRNPYDDSTNHTPEKKTYVIDLNIDVDKVAENASGKKLDGAEFKLYRMNGTSKEYYKKDTNAVTWVATQAAGDTFTTDTSGKLTTQVQGLDKGEYYLEETKAPEGYNVLAAPVKVTITVNEADDKVTYSATTDGAAAKVDNGTVDLTAAQASTQPVAVATIVNNAGSILPSTGGIGTTIFYIVGAILVLGAGILLVTRRRMNAN